MAISLQRIDSVPTLKDQSFEMQQWFYSLVSTINSSLQQIEDSLNTFTVQSFTTAQITALATTVPNGTLFYDSDTNQLKAKVNGVVMVIV